ncbi:MAG TPA: transcription termination factor Rho, partial [Ktedonobacterales bacterium]
RPQGQQGRQPRGQTYPGGYSNPQGQRWNTGRPDQQRNQPGRRNQPTPDRRNPTPGRGQPQQGRPQRNAPSYPSANQRQPQTPARVVEVKGIFWAGGGQGLSQAELLDERTLQSIARFNPEDARRMGLRSGDIVSGTAEERGGRRTVVAMEAVNDGAVENLQERRLFEQLTATFPTRRIRLEQGPRPVSVRIIDLFSPLGFGSRALIVAPPKTGKTTLIREAAEAVLQGYPDAVVMAVLVGERPEEVTDLRARIEPNGGHVYAASFDEQTERHAWLVQVAVERAKRVAESGKDAFMVLDSLTRLARAENLASRGQGRTLSGGIDAQALDTGRRAFGAARNLDEGGSITILATCLVETGSRQDDVVYEEFKGTGNMELHLSRELSQRRLFPSVDVIKSGTRREEMLLSPEELRAATLLRRRLADLPVTQATEQLLKVMERTPSNAALIQALDTTNGR